MLVGKEIVAREDDSAILKNLVVLKGMKQGSEDERERERGRIKNTFFLDFFCLSYFFFFFFFFVEQNKNKNRFNWQTQEEVATLSLL